MRLIIAEKPSLARAIAEALPGSPKRQDGAIVCGDTTVTWCLGHLLEQSPPEAYDPADKQWRLDRLPIVPGTWKLMPHLEAHNFPSQKIDKDFHRKKPDEVKVVKNERGKQS